MRDQVFKYSRVGMKIYDEIPPECPECKGTRLLESSTADAPFTTHGYAKSMLKKSHKYIIMCTGCGLVLGYKDQSVKPSDITATHERPDLSAKYEAVLTGGQY